MRGILNILNGDATLEKFKQSGLSGEIVVWREILSEGPVGGDTTEKFFQLRAEWLSKAFHAPVEEYRSKVIEEFNRLQKEQGDFDEIILWFEFDLTCQINLLFLLNFFHKERKLNRLYLICPEKFPGYPNFKGIGELKPEEYAALRTLKSELTERDLEVAVEGWNAYRSGDPQAIKDFIEKDHARLPLLKPALKAHLSRFPDKNGLNWIDRELIRIHQTGVRNKTAIFRQFSDRAKIYGMTDLSVFKYLDKLEASGHIVM